MIKKIAMTATQRISRPRRGSRRCERLTGVRPERWVMFHPSNNGLILSENKNGLSLVVAGFYPDHPWMA